MWYFISGFSVDLYVCLYSSTSLSEFYLVGIFEIEKCESSNFVLFQDCLGYSGSLAIPYEFSTPSCLKKENYSSVSGLQHL